LPLKKITENDIELYAIEELESLGYTYSYGPEIAPDSDHSQRTCYDQVVLTNHLKDAIATLNPDIPTTAQEDAVKQVM